jgi:predicted helicase
VQILDPATGTGTFLAETIKHIHKKFEGQQGIWSKYVETHLLPRLNGFELLMASYAMAHLKLDLLLTETGYKPTTNQRFRVYLTNSLEESHPDTGTLFANWLSTEANEANHIKRDTPVMCVIGNPPYAVSSSNKSDWIEKLTADYKKDMVERNIQPLSDDYIKFIRFGQHFIDKNGSGVLAYISNNSFIDGIIHRQMRKHLLESFDTIYVLDLHGNAKRKEVCPDGSADQNVFDIMQGVSINIFIKTGNKKKNELAKIYNYDLQGTREFKYDFLNQNNLKSLKWNLLNFTSPNYFFVNKNFEGINEYEEYFDVSKLFLINSVGVVTSCDDKVLAENKEDLKVKISKYFEDEEFKNDKVLNYLYRPFEIKKIYFEPKYLGRSREKIMQHYKQKNVGLIISKQFGGHKQFILFITNSINDKSSQPFAPYYNHPLYLYPETKGQQTIGQSTERTPNLNTEIVKQIAEKLGLTFTNEKETTKNTFAPIDILDYIYAVLHSPTYREKYKEFLKIDFPKIPYPKNKDTFWKLVKLGGEIRQIHLLESPAVEKYITQYPEDGNNIVTKPKYQDGKVYINETQYFDNVPQVAWAFYIGGYQPAQKWLKDRKERTLEFDDILHYQKIIVALSETDRLMKEIDKIEIG